MAGARPGLLMDSLTDPQVLRADPATTQVALSAFESPAATAATRITAAPASNAGISVLVTPATFDTMTAVAAARSESALHLPLELTAPPPATIFSAEALPAAAVPELPMPNVQETITCYTNTGDAVAEQPMDASLPLAAGPAAAAAAVMKAPYLKEDTGDSVVCVPYQYQCSEDLPIQAQLACSPQETNIRQWKYVYGAAPGAACTALKLADAAQIAYRSVFCCSTNLCNRPINIDPVAVPAELPAIPRVAISSSVLPVEVLDGSDVGYTTFHTADPAHSAIMDPVGSSMYTTATLPTKGTHGLSVKRKAVASDGHAPFVGSMMTALTAAVVVALMMIVVRQ
eukprot:gene7223-7436_t